MYPAIFVYVWTPHRLSLASPLAQGERTKVRGRRLHAPVALITLPLSLQGRGDPTSCNSNWGSLTLHQLVH